MTDFNEQTLLEAVIKSVAATPDPRLRQIMTSLVKHLHASPHQLIERSKRERDRRVGPPQRLGDVALHRHARAGRRVDSQQDGRPELRWVALRHGHIHRCQHALARRRVDGIADHADDLVARVGLESQAHALPDRLFARQKPAHERFVHDGNRTAAHAVAGLEVPAAPQRDAHRLEPAWRRAVQPERGPDAGHWSIADGDHAGAGTAPGEQPHRRDSRRADP